MRCDEYQSTKLRNKYVLVPTGTDPMNVLPAAEVKSLGRLEKIKSLEVADVAGGVGAPGKEILKAIAAQGYYIGNPISQVLET